WCSDGRANENPIACHLLSSSSSHDGTKPGNVTAGREKFAFHTLQSASGGLMTRKFGFVKRILLSNRSANAGSCLQALAVVPEGRPGGKLDARRHGPIQHGVEICIGNAEALEKKVPMAQMVVEVGKARCVSLQGVSSRALRRLFVKQRNK